MKIVRSQKYIAALQEIMRFISLDSKKRALAFRSQIDKQISSLADMPYKCRKSIYFDDEHIRDLIYKGYTIVYKVDEREDLIVIVGIKKHQNDLG